MPDITFTVFLVPTKICSVKTVRTENGLFLSRFVEDDAGIPGVFQGGRNEILAKRTVFGVRRRLSYAYVTFSGSMSRENYISFIALVSGDTLIFKKLYPEWSVGVRFPLFRRCTLYWYVSNKGLMKKDVTPSAFL